jgi:drug/metabolite transporter (DMT)-like permease
VEVVALLLAFAAACCNALSSVLQRRANRDETDMQFGLRMLVAVVKHPAWLVGLTSMIASFLLQATALGMGTLASVEPVLALELPATLLLAAWLLKVNLPHRDIALAAAMALGLALFIAALKPSGGDAGNVSILRVGLAAAITAGGIAAILAAGKAGPRRARAAAYGAAAGGGFGLTASLMKVAITALEDAGFSGLFTAWETYAAMVFGVLSVVLVQAALHAGTLVAAQPGLTLMDPLVSVVWGVAVLGEHVRLGAALVFAALGAVIVAAAVLVLARSRALVGDGSGKKDSARQGEDSESAQASRAR